MLRRSPQCDGYWHPVAGGVEVGETETQAAAREVLEELSLETDVRALDIHYSYPLREEPWRIALYGPGVEEVSVECFALEVEAAWEPTLNDEHDAYRWCVLEEAVELLFWPEPRDVLRELARRLAAA